MDTSNDEHRPYQQLFPDQPHFGYIMQLTPVIYFTNNVENSQQNLHQPSINSPRCHDENRLVHITNLSDHNSPEVVSMTQGQGRHDQLPNYASSYDDPYNEVNLEVEQIGRDDSRILDMANSNIEDTDVLSEHVYNEIPNPHEVGDESPGISTPAPFSLFGIDLNMMPPREEAHHQTDHNVMHVPENNHHSLVHYREGDSRVSEETIMGHMQITNYTATTTLSLNEEPDICVICQGEFEYGEFIGSLRCGHEYHVQCIKKWVQQINNCPICKATAVS